MNKIKATTLDGYYAEVRERICAKSGDNVDTNDSTYRPSKSNPNNLTIAELFKVQVSDTAIDFYSTSTWFGEFGNFPQYELLLDGKTWRSSEHYFQAKKFAGTKFEEELRNIPSSGDVAKKGRDRSLPLRQDWDLPVDIATVPGDEQFAKDWERFVGAPMLTKDLVMLTAVRAKFAQHECLAWLLLASGDKFLTEHTVNDRYWGDNGDRTGKNMLGKILMIVREELRRKG